MKTIRRNAKNLAEIFSTAKNCKSFSLPNGFSGKGVPADCVREQYDTFSFAKLQQISANRYQVSVHSNQWYEFEV